MLQNTVIVITFDVSIYLGVTIEFKIRSTSGELTFSLLGPNVSRLDKHTGGISSKARFKRRTFHVPNASETKDN
jgi:hypothetical protein